MEDTARLFRHDENLSKEAPHLVALLKELKDALDTVTNKVKDLTGKVKADLFPTTEGISYLDAKYLLLLNYCQSLVYYVLCKARGFSIEGHPVVRSLVEIRLFLEKIRSIDKKMHYQIQKLTRFNESAKEKTGLNRDKTTTENVEDLLTYRPNPGLLVSKSNMASEDGGVYRPPKFAPAAMEGDNISKQEKNTMRKEKETLKRARQSAYMRELMDDVEGRPEEVRDTVGSESRELTRYMAKIEDRAKREEELFTRVPVTKMEKRKAKHLAKSRNGLLGLMDGFSDDINTLPIEDDDKDEQPRSIGNNFNTGKKINDRKRRY